jgi:hypothetical protein
MMWSSLRSAAVLRGAAPPMMHSRHRYVRKCRALLSGDLHGGEWREVRDQWSDC